MAVNISGTVLASLFYDNSSSSGDQTGFLVGEIVHHVQDTISDSQINNREVKTKTYVFDCIPCPKDQLFHNTCGEIQQQQIKDLLPGKHKKIVGWYSFRRNSTIRPSYRERLLHYNLSDLLCKDGNRFLFLLCSAKASSNRSTHTFDHSFLHVERSIFKKVPVDIINLGDTTHTEYRREASHTVDSTHGAFSKIVQSKEEEFLNSYGQMEVRQIQMLNGAIRRQLDSISQSVIDSEARCSELEQELTRYRKRAKLKLLEQQQQQEALEQKEKPKVNKGPSVDDILSMDDQVNDLHSEILGGQGHGVKIKSERSTSDSSTLNTETSSGSEEEQMETLASSFDKDVNLKKAKLHSVRLTAPISVHTRSASLPVDTDTESSHVKDIRTRSRSGDDNSETKPEEKINDKNGKDTKGRTKARPEDPFDFVGSMIAESKKDSQRSHYSGRSKNNVYDADAAMETEGSVPRAHGNQKQTKHSAAAVSVAKTFNQSSRTTRGQRSKVQEEETEGSSKGQDVDGNLHKLSDESLHLESSKKHRNLKTCGQEVGQKQPIEIITDESSSSQDTYEMDVSSSPVY